MGWTSYYRVPGESDRDHLQREICGESLTILDSTTIKNVFYAAVKNNETGQVWGLVVLQQRTRDAYGHNYARKEISEDMGPGDIDCPVRILDLLTPTTSEYALEWREACRTRAARKAAQPKVKKGDVVRFSQPLTFGDGRTLDTLTFVERSIFTTGYFRYRIPSWKSLTFEVVAQA